VGYLIRSDKMAGEDLIKREEGKAGFGRTAGTWGAGDSTIQREHAFAAEIHRRNTVGGVRQRAGNLLDRQPMSGWPVPRDYCSPGPKPAKWGSSARRGTEHPGATPSTISPEKFSTPPGTRAAMPHTCSIRFSCMPRFAAPPICPQHLRRSGGPVFLLPHAELCFCGLAWKSFRQTKRRTTADSPYTIPWHA
jgi:hypothetical protein